MLTGRTANEDAIRVAFFGQKIVSLGTAKAWLDELVRRGLDFHFEDSPETVWDIRTGKRTFADHEVPIIRDRVRELYAIDWAPEGVECPIGYVLKISPTE